MSTQEPGVGGDETEIHALYEAIFNWHHAFVTKRQQTEDQQQQHQDQPPSSEGVSDGLGTTMDAWFWRTKSMEAATLLRSMARIAPCVFHCTHLSEGIVTNKDIAGKGGDGALAAAQGCVEQVFVVSFIRAAMQIVSVALDICVWEIRQKGQHSRNAASESDSDADTVPESESGILSRLRPHLWTIMGIMEQALFFDPRPFWSCMVSSAQSYAASANDTSDPTLGHGVAGIMGDSSSEDGLQIGKFLWELYVRMFLLAGFRIQHQYRRLRHQYLQTPLGSHQSTDATHSPRSAAAAPDVTDHQESAEATPFDPATQRRPVRSPVDLGFGSDPDDEADDADLENWPMSILFQSLANIADEWTRVSYTPSIVCLIARCLLRYGMIGYVRTSPQMRAFADQHQVCYVHDWPDYTVESVRVHPGWLGVNRRTYYGGGGTKLREMLRHLCLVAHTDTFLAALTDPETIDPDPTRFPDRLLDRGLPELLRKTCWRRSLAERLWTIMDTSLEQFRQPLDTDSDSIVGSGQDRDQPRHRHSAWFLAHGNPGLDPGSEDNLYNCALMMQAVENDRIDLRLVAYPIHRIEEIRCMAEQCFDAMARFLDSGEGIEAERAFQKAGMYHMLIPGEIWQFCALWPNMGVTPLNIVNAFRPGDARLYQDHITGARISKIARTRGAELPPCLLTLVDSLSWETMRNFLRMFLTREGTEAFPDFMLEPHHLESILLDFTRHHCNGEPWTPHSTNSPYFDRFYRWTRLLRQPDRDSNDDRDRWTALIQALTKVVTNSQHLPAPGWNRSVSGDSTTTTTTTTTATSSNRTGEGSDFPPFPQILSMRGRLLLWNPFAKPVPQDWAMPDETESAAQGTRYERASSPRASRSASSSDDDEEDAKEDQSSYSDIDMEDADSDLDQALHDWDRGNEVVDPAELRIYKLVPCAAYIRPWLGPGLIDLSTTSVPIVFLLWLWHRILLIESILECIADPMAVAKTVGTAKARSYMRVLQELVCQESNDQSSAPLRGPVQDFGNNDMQDVEGSRTLPIDPTERLETERARRVMWIPPVPPPPDSITSCGRKRPRVSWTNMQS